MALTAEQIIDLTTTTLRELGRMKWTDISRDLQEYYFMPQIMQKERVSFQAGYGIQRSIQVSSNEAASHVGMFATDTVNVSDVMQTITVPWRHTTTNYAFERREIAMNRTPERIVELLKIRRKDAMGHLAEVMETAGWGKPTTSSDNTTPFGIKMWIVNNTSTGFNGGNPSGFTSGAGGLSSSTYPNWSNYTAQFANITKNDAVTKMRRAFRFIHFKNPVTIPTYDRGAPRYGIYMDYPTLAALETLAENQNDMLGNDIASKDGKTVFRGVEMNWVPQLDTDSLTTPIYFINWSVISPVFLRGEYLNESKPTNPSDQHTTFKVHIDLTWNTLCTDRRKLALLVGGG